jgi:hypothetical protein
MRALSSLYVLKSLMLAIRRIERAMDPAVMSSFDPLRSPRENTVSEYDTKVGEHLPSHYFG